MIFRSDKNSGCYCFHRLIMGKVEIRNFYCFIVDNRILFLQKSLLNSSPYFIRLLTELLNLIGCRGKIKSEFSKKVCFSRTISRFKATYMFMVFATSLVVFLFLCYCRYFDETFTAMLLVFHCCGYTWAIVR